MQLKIEDASRRLRTGDYGIPTNPDERFEKRTSDCSNVKAIELQKAKAELFCERSSEISFKHGQTA